MKYADLTLGQIEAVCNKLGGKEGVVKFLRDELIVQPIPVKQTIPEPPLNFIVHVDCAVSPSYPDFVKKIMHPDLELTGPAEYDMQTLGLLLHNDQKSGYTTGNKIYERLKKDKALNDCLGLTDLLAIQAKGIKVFRSLFAGKAVFGWKSVVQSTNGILLVPYLIGDGGRVVLNWRWLGSYWNSNNPALRFSK